MKSGYLGAIRHCAKLPTYTVEPLPVSIIVTTIMIRGTVHTNLPLEVSFRSFA